MASVSELASRREATLGGAHTVDSDRLPSISVVVPIRNEARFIEATLSQLLAQDYDPSRWEVLVIDGRSTDGTYELVKSIAERQPRLRVFDNPKRLSSAARNLGIRYSTGEIVVIVDGHCDLDNRSYLRLLVDVFMRSKADCVGRPQPLDVRGATTLQRAIALARASRLGHHPDSHVFSDQEGIVPAKSVAVAYRRAIFAQIGPFDEEFDACEDVEFNHRVDRTGLRCCFSPAVAVRYVPRQSLWGLFRQMLRYGRGRVRLLRKHGDTFGWRTFLPALFALGLLAGACLSPFSPWLAVAYASCLGVYAILVAATSLAIVLSQGNPRLLFWLPLVFATIHLGAGAGQWIEAVFGRRSARKRNEGSPS